MSAHDDFVRIASASREVALLQSTRNKYTMGCPPVCGDNSRALASELSYVQVVRHGIQFHTTYTSVDLSHHEIVHAYRERSGSVVECLTRDSEAAGSSLTGVTTLCP